MMERRSFALAFAVSMAALLLAGGAAADSETLLPLKLPSGKIMQTELMIKDADRQMGLMFRPSLAPDHALLFIFDDAGFHGIWMKNCKFPIDIVWLDEDHSVVHVAEKAPPCKTEPCEVYTPQRKAAYVIEMNAGLARREKVTIGSKVDFTLPR